MFHIILYTMKQNKLFFVIITIILFVILYFIYLDQQDNENIYEPFVKDLVNETCQCTSSETMNMITMKLQKLQEESNENAKQVGLNKKEIDKNTTYIDKLQKRIEEETKKLMEAVKPRN